MTNVRMVSLLIVREGKLVGRVQSADLPIWPYFKTPVEERPYLDLSQVELFSDAGSFDDGDGGWELHVSGTADLDGIYSISPGSTHRPSIVGSVRMFELASVKFISKRGPSVAKDPTLGIDLPPLNEEEQNLLLNSIKAKEVPVGMGALIAYRKRTGASVIGASLVINAERDARKLP